MTTVSQALWFERDMEVAVGWYASLIPGSAIDWVQRLPVDTPSGPAGTVPLAGFHLGDQRYIAIEGGPLDAFNHSVSIMVECDGQAEIDRLWAALAEGGQEEQCGWVRDRYGLYWQIAPRRLGELMRGEPEAARRVAAAMMTMVKFDIAALEAAARADGPDGV